MPEGGRSALLEIAPAAVCSAIELQGSQRSTSGLNSIILLYRSSSLSSAGVLHVHFASLCQRSPVLCTKDNYLDFLMGLDDWHGDKGVAVQMGWASAQTAWSLDVIASATSSTSMPP